MTDLSDKLSGADTERMNLLKDLEEMESLQKKVSNTVSKQTRLNNK